MSCSRFIQFLQAHTSTPERDATSLRSSPGGRSVVEVSTSFPSEKVYILVRVVVEGQAARFYKFASKVLWSRRHLVSWDSWHKVPTNPSEPSVRCESPSSESVPCGELINLAAVRCPLVPNLNMNFPKLLLCYLIWCSTH